MPPSRTPPFSVISITYIKNTTITIYTYKKGHKVIFSGPNALKEAQLFNPEAQIKETKEKVVTNFITFQEQIGSDEVGFGDFFGGKDR